jgi:hypothetical protein
LSGDLIEEELDPLYKRALLGIVLGLAVIASIIVYFF